MKSKVIYISSEAEILNNIKLLEKIKESGFVNKDTVLVNCQPQFSSSLSQFTNHKLSHLAGNRLLEQLTLEIPLKGMNQILDPETFEYQYFELYLQRWIKKYVGPDLTYLFLTNIMHNSLYNRIVSHMKASEAGFRTAAVYVSTESVLQPDFYVEKTDGRILFEWENSDNLDRIF